MPGKRSPKAMQKATKRSKRAAKRISEKIPHLLSNENPSYIDDKEKLLALLKGSKSRIPRLFYDVESFLKTKNKREEVFSYCTAFVNGKMKGKDVIFFLNYQEKKVKYKAKWWPFKK